jgi:predicted nuclease with TOPRIM domain
MWSHVPLVTVVVFACFFEYQLMSSREESLEDRLKGLEERLERLEANSQQDESKLQVEQDAEITLDEIFEQLESSILLLDEKLRSIKVCHTNKEMNTLYAYFKKIVFSYCT